PLRRAPPRLRTTSFTLSSRTRSTALWGQPPPILGPPSMPGSTGRSDDHNVVAQDCLYVGRRVLTGPSLEDSPAPVSGTLRYGKAPRCRLALKPACILGVPRYRPRGWGVVMGKAMLQDLAFR